MRILSPAVYASLFLLSTTTYAVPVRFDFTGTIDHTTASPGMPNILSSIIPDGTSFSGHYVFDTDSTGIPYSSNDISYENSITEFRIDIGDYFIEFNNGAIGIIDNGIFSPAPGDEGVQDIYTAQARLDIPSQPTTLLTNIEVPGYSLVTAGLWAYDESANMLSGVSLSNYAPDITGTQTEFLLDFNLNGGLSLLSAYGQLNSLTPVAPPIVPLPSSFGLFSSALILLFHRFIKAKN